MIDLRWLRDSPEAARAVLGRRRNPAIAGLIDTALRLDADRRELLQKAERLKAERNAASTEVGRLKQRGEEAGDRLGRLKTLSDLMTLKRVVLPAPFGPMTA